MAVSLPRRSPGHRVQEPWCQVLEIRHNPPNLEGSIPLAQTEGCQGTSLAQGQCQRQSDSSTRAKPAVKTHCTPSCCGESGREHQARSRRRVPRAPFPEEEPDLGRAGHPGATGRASQDPNVRLLTTGSWKQPRSHDFCSERTQWSPRT